jgi:hypothetical protein
LKPRCEVTRARARRGAAFGAFRMKQLNVFPMLAMLLVVLAVIYWLWSMS